jgi:hypothetical protein
LKILRIRLPVTTIIAARPCPATVAINASGWTLSTPAIGRHIPRVATLIANIAWTGGEAAPAITRRCYAASTRAASSTGAGAAAPGVATTAPGRTTTPGAATPAKGSRTGHAVAALRPMGSASGPERRLPAAQIDQLRRLIGEWFYLAQWFLTFSSAAQRVLLLGVMMYFSNSYALDSVLYGS